MSGGRYFVICFDKKLTTYGKQEWLAWVYKESINPVSSQVLPRAKGDSSVAVTREN